jgi:hypothetical protein
MILPDTNQRPALTVILPTWDTFDALRTTVAHLRTQTVASSIELIIVAPSAERATPPADEVQGLHSVRVLETGDMHATGPARAQAIRAASASVVAFAEDHCFPRPDWAEALIAAHRGPHAAVGPAVYNANPETVTSWADLYLGYGRWLGPGRRREVELLPGHNSSYKRDVLVDYGGELDHLMEAETVLLWDLRRKGHTLLFEPAARVEHTNFSSFGVFIDVQWHLGRVFAATRATHWSLMRRLAYALAAPGIPFIRLSHIVHAAASNGSSRRRLAATLPVIGAALLVDFAAQATGALFGAGRSVAILSAYEFHRVDVNRTKRRPTIHAGEVRRAT